MPDPHVDGGIGVKTIVYNTKKYSKGRRKKKDKKRERDRERDREKKGKEIQQ